MAARPNGKTARPNTVPRQLWSGFLLATVCTVAVARAHAGSKAVLVAVAANFLEPAERLGELFEKQSPYQVTFSVGSTGKLYAQIVNGAPYALLLAADAERPALLESSNHGLAGTRFTYAIGELVLWSADAELAGTEALEAVGEGSDFFDQLTCEDLLIAGNGDTSHDIQMYGVATVYDPCGETATASIGSSNALVPIPAGDYEIRVV